MAQTIPKDATASADVRRFYDAAGWHAMWTPARRRTLQTLLAARDRHGLERIAFLRDGDGTLEDVRLTEAALAYAAALARGHVDPKTLHDVYTLPRPGTDVAAGLSKALRADDLARWIDSLAPQDAEYRQLSEAYLVFSQKAAAPDRSATPVADGNLIHVGESDPRVPAIVEQLNENGYAVTGDTTSVPQAASTRYTAVVSEAIKGLQRDYGIAADGIVGPATLSVLNVGPDDRARALAVALERRRWLDRTPPATRIDVNTAAAELRYYRDGVVADERKVVVGEPGRETPALLAPIYRLVANPTWTVPKSIQNGELAKADDAYLAAHDMVMKDGWIVQQPGPNNALGLVKFDMIDDQAIYLHDTSAPALFARSQRHLSHGCVRVDDAAGFAQMLAEDQGIGEAWATAQANGETSFVPLPKRIPVRLLYHDVFADTAGRIVFRADSYGWNDAVAKALGFAAAGARQAQAQAIDVGP